MENKEVRHSIVKGLISLQEAAQICKLSQSHLRLLVRKGDLQGWKIGRNWVTTQEAIDEYLSLGRKPGPKKRD